MREREAALTGMEGTLGAILETAQSTNKSVHETQRKILQELSSAAREEAVSSPFVRSGKRDVLTQLRGYLAEERYADAFAFALDQSDLDVVTWLCSKIEPEKIFSAHPMPLSNHQPVLLSLVQQLGHDLTKEPELKLHWLRESLLFLDPAHPKTEKYFNRTCATSL